MKFLCKVLCSSSDADKLEDLGIMDPGIWTDMVLDLDCVVAMKRSGADENEDKELYHSTTVYTEFGDSYVLNVPFEKMAGVWMGTTIEEGDSNKEINL